jgi:hypothetical protein
VPQGVGYSVEDLDERHAVHARRPAMLLGQRVGVGEDARLACQRAGAPRITDAPQAVAEIATLISRSPRRSATCSCGDPAPARSPRPS